MRKKYFGRFWFRVFVFCAAIWLYFVSPGSFRVLEADNFIKEFSEFHILWIIWILDMVLKLFPIKGTLALGALKHLKAYYVPTDRTVNIQKAEQYQKENHKRALIVFGVWSLLGIALGVLWKTGVLGTKELFWVSVFFYVCDLICVLMWCPFRVWFLKNRCCTTCRIFNWDHFMMFTPLVFVDSFYCKSLFYCGLLVMLIWEYRIHRYPERFYEGTNEALKCRNCTDHLCGRHECGSASKINHGKAQHNH